MPGDSSRLTEGQQVPSHRDESARSDVPLPVPDPGSQYQAVLARLDKLETQLRAQAEELRLKLAATDRSLRQLDRRVVAIEASWFFRILRWLGTAILDRQAKLGQILKRAPFRRLYLKILNTQARRQYDAWLAVEEARVPTAEWYRDRAHSFEQRPFFSILMVVDRATPEWLNAAIDSVQKQSYPHWELCVCDDASQQAWVAEYFSEKAEREPRLRFVKSTARLGAARALNRAGQLARGDYIVLLGQDDVFAPHLLYYLAEAAQHEDPALIYTDEDSLDESGCRVDPIFKPDWSPELLTSCMYMGRGLAVSKKAIDRVGWFRSEFDGYEDYDLVLRITDCRVVVLHIPRVLYHSRKQRGKSSASLARAAGLDQAAVRCLAEAALRRGWRATVEESPLGRGARLRWEVCGEPRVSIIICSRTASLLKSCLRAIGKNTAYPNIEIVVVEHVVGKCPAMDALSQLRSCRRVRYAGAFSFSKMNNQGAAAASGEVFVFLNDDVEPLVPGWLTSLVAHAQRPEVGAVGAKLLYPSGSLQHVGLIIGLTDEGCGHLLRRAYGSPFWAWHEFTRDVSAVTGACLAVRRSVFEELGGFDEALPVNYSDADFCLRARRAGYSVICEPAAVLRHYECRTRRPGVAPEERATWFQRWATLLERGDPFYNPNLTSTREDASLRFDN